MKGTKGSKSGDINLMTLVERFSTEDAARAYLEAQRWPNGPVCPHCGGADPYRLTPKADSKRPGRPGLLKCRACRKQFTVRVGTIFEDSKIPLRAWVIAIHLMSASKKGMSAHQLHRMLGVTYRSAWFMAHRLRWAMTQEPLASKLEGVVEVDEVYLSSGSDDATSRRGTKRIKGMWDKIPVMTLVERGGRTRSFVPPRVTANNIGPVLAEHISENAVIMTDEGPWYRSLAKTFKAGHHRVSHSRGEYARNVGAHVAHVNSAESFFSILRRALHGTFHHVSRHHLPRYLAEFDFRASHRHVTDGERAHAIVRGAERKRLMLRATRGNQPT
jgi:transposase-like protein